MRWAVKVSVAGLLAAWLCVGVAAGASPRAPAAKTATSAKTAATKAKLERQQREEAARAKVLKAKAEAARRDEVLLKAGLAKVETQAAQTKAAATETEAQAAALDTRRLTEAADLARDRRALELMVTALLQGEAATRGAPAFVTDARAGAVAGFAVLPLARATRDGEAQIEITAREREALSVQRQELSAEGQKLAAAREETAAKLADTGKMRLALLAESDRAAKNAAALGRQAKTLNELATKVSAQRKPTMLTGVSTGARRAPADGVVVSKFGAATSAGPAKGLTVRTKAGAKIVAPGNGTVGYAGLFRSYGQVLIIDQDDGTSLVLTGLQSVLATPGKKVSVGETVGEMAAASAPTPPELYFEVRQAGRTVDPERWLKAKS